MPVPLLDVNAQNLPLEAELLDVFTRVLRTGRFILGEEVEAFEAECAALTGAAHAVSMSSGTDALLASFMALGLGPGDEVICPSFTFFATAGCISRTGATPVFCDVDPVDFNLSPESVEQRITPRTKAVVPVHLFGQSADMDALGALAERHGLAVVEDACQAIGATWNGRGCGSIGDFGCYSFFPSKNLGGFGDGGLTVTNDADRAETLRRIRNHGMHPRYHHAFVGANFRMDALQCALLRVKLRHYAEYTAGRRRNAAFYLDALAGIGPDRLALPSVIPSAGHIWNQFTLRLPAPGSRDALRAHLAERGIGCEIYYPVPLHHQECFRNLPPASLAPCPVSEQLSREVLSLPVYPELTPAQLGEVADAVRSFFA